MLKTLRAYSSWSSAVAVLLDPLGRTETDLFQIRNIEGLGPVTAAINTSQLGSLDGDTYMGSTVGSRNIVLTVKLNPDWSTWTYEKLRQLLYTYFMPKKRVRLVFETDEFPPVEIFGYVESNEPKLFSKDGEITVSVICPYPYFTSVDPVVLTGTTWDDAVIVNYSGTVESGISAEVHSDHFVGFMSMLVRIGDPLSPYFTVYVEDIDSDNYFMMSSIPGQKYVRRVQISSGIITNILSSVEPGSIWPAFQPGENSVQVTTSGGGAAMDWTLTYYNRYGGL